MGIVYHRLGAQLFHPVGGYRVHTFGHGKPDRHALACGRAHGIVGGPGGWILAGKRECHRGVGYLKAWRVAIVDNGGIHKRLDGGSGLPFALHHVIKLKVFVINASNPGLDVP